MDKTSASLQRRLNIPPGIHGKKRKRALSEFGQQLREKQKAKEMYGILEKQFKRLVQNVSRQKGDTGELLLGKLETRLDNVIYRLGFAKTRYQARQLVGHGHVTVNGKKNSIPSYQVQEGDIVALTEKMQKKQAEIAQADHVLLPFLSKEDTIGRLVRLPKREDVEVPFSTQLIIEYYSR